MNVASSFVYPSSHAEYRQKTEGRTEIEIGKVCRCEMYSRLQDSGVKNTALRGVFLPISIYKILHTRLQYLLISVVVSTFSI